MIIPGSGVVAQQWRDEDGRWWSSVVPAGTRESEASQFPITGPPPDLVDRLVADFGMGQAAAVALHNELFHAGILTARDVRMAGARERIAAAIQRSLRLGVEEVVAVYTGA